MHRMSKGLCIGQNHLDQLFVGKLSRYANLLPLQNETSCSCLSISLAGMKINYDIQLSDDNTDANKI